MSVARAARDIFEIEIDGHGGVGIVGAHGWMMGWVRGIVNGGKKG
jgi:ABC-type Co2+ transport system permease subunit